MATKQDARGVITSYAYDSLHRVTQVSYNTVSGVTTAPTVTYVYDYDVNYGTRRQRVSCLRVNVGSDYQERYTFDGMLRVSSAIRTIGSSHLHDQLQQLQRSEPVDSDDLSIARGR